MPDSVDVETIEEIRKFIMEKSGLHFDRRDVDALRDTIVQRMSEIGCRSYGDYYELLRQAHDRREFAELLNRLTIKHTCFFRNPEQFIALRDKVLPEIVQRKSRSGDLSVRVLSGGCSTGEEPYSVAMVLLEMFGENSAWDLSVLAVDISTQALDVARRGVYARRVLRLVEEDFIERYIERFCRVDEEKVAVNAEVKRMVTFQYINLLDGSLPGEFDIIFCRHVTIYFELETVKRVIGTLSKVLAPGGFLFTGGTETLYGISNEFKLLEGGNALIYRRVPVDDVEERSLEPRRTRESRRRTPRQSEGPPSRPAARRKPLGPAEAVELYKKAKKLFARKAYGEAVALAREALKADPRLHEGHLLLARIFVNLERFREAAEACRSAAQLAPLSARPHYLLGLIHWKAGKPAEALEEFGKATYLDPACSVAHFARAELHRERGERTEALRNYRNALKAVVKVSDGCFKELAEGLTREMLAQLCVKKMRQLSGRGEHDD